MPPPARGSFASITMRLRPDPTFVTPVVSFHTGWSFNPVSGPPPRPSSQDLSFVPPVDSSSPMLALLLITGTRLPKVIIQIARSAEEPPYITFTLENALVTSSRPGGNTRSGEEALEEVSIGYSAITYQYQDPDTGAKTVAKLGPTGPIG